jgi:transposase InsO family protein
MRAATCLWSRRCTGCCASTARPATGAAMPPNRPCEARAAATAPNQCWSWDITKLAGPARWRGFYLYVILDIYSRYVVGWMVAHWGGRQPGRAAAGRRHRQPAHRSQPADHPCRPSTSMTAKPVAMLLADLGVTESHARPTPTTTLQREPVQDPQAPSQLPRPVRLYPGRPRLLPGLLRLVQLRAPLLRHGVAHPC